MNGNEQIGTTREDSTGAAPDAPYDLIDITPFGIDLPEAAVALLKEIRERTTVHETFCNHRATPPYSAVTELWLEAARMLLADEEGRTKARARLDGIEPILVPVDSDLNYDWRKRRK